jgi:hypothetical protein
VLGHAGGEGVMNNFLYGMWFMWFILCVIAHNGQTTLSLFIGTVIIPALLILMARGVWFVVRLVKFKWEKRNGRMD